MEKMFSQYNVDLNVWGGLAPGHGISFHSVSKYVFLVGTKI